MAFHWREGDGERERRRREAKFVRNLRKRRGKTLVATAAIGGGAELLLQPLNNNKEKL